MMNFAMFIMTMMNVSISAFGPIIIGILVLGILTLLGFAYHKRSMVRREHNPIVNLNLFKSKTFVVTRRIYESNYFPRQEQGGDIAVTLANTMHSAMIFIMISLAIGAVTFYLAPK